MDTSTKIKQVTESLNDLLQEKNKRYGNSALEGVKIFSNITNSSIGIGMRLDDKLARIKNSGEYRKNDIADIMGYLVLLCINEDYLDFSDLID